MKYEIDKRYAFEATEDGICPVQTNATVFVWRSDGSVRRYSEAGLLQWKIGTTITHFMVIEYPLENKTGWKNIYPLDYTSGCVYATIWEADAQADMEPRVACIYSTAGDGL
ncbi:MAG: hypothetical protein COA84_13895 [Robiginitomaculum sp.]|nr:MAG: hypothetical protein COA84_13895 [Robiginitomaculum sp.]